MSGAGAILQGSGTLTPEAARRTLLTGFDVPPGTGSLTCRLTFAPARVNGIRNLITLALFEPGGASRGAAHRHEPVQVVEIGANKATRGFVAGALPPGRWTVALDVHCVVPSDVGGVRYTLDVEATARDGEDDPPPTMLGGGDAVPDLGPVRWLKGDLHVHSDHSDGRWGIDAVVAHARTNALDFIALTDHNTSTGTAPLREALRDAGLATIVIPGLELTTFAGHANVLGIEGWVDWRTRLPGGGTSDDDLDDAFADPSDLADLAGAGDAGTTRMVVAGEGDVPVEFALHRPAGKMEATARAIQSRGGLFVVNHPRSAGYPACTGCRWDFDDAPAYADVIEVMNGDWPRRQNDEAMVLWDRWLASGWRIPATAGSDAHGAPAHPDRVGYTWAWSVPEVASIIGSVRAGRTFLSRGPHVSWEAPRPGAEVARATTSLAVRLGGVPAGCLVHFVCDGRLVEFRPVPEGDSVQAFPLHARPLAGTWFRVHLVHQPKVGTPELVALTNPVWVGR